MTKILEMKTATGRLTLNFHEDVNGGAMLKNWNPNGALFQFMSFSQDEMLHLKQLLDAWALLR